MTQADAGILGGAALITAGRRARRLARARAGREARRPGRGGADPRPRRASASTTSRCRSSAASTSATPGDVLTLLGLVGVMNVVNFSDGIDGLAAGVCAISRRGVRDHRVRPRHGRAPACSRRSRPAPRSASSCTTSTRRRSSWATAARNLLGLLLGGVIVEGSLKTNAADRADRAAGRARRAVPRHGLRRRQADQVPPARLPGRLQPLPPPLPPDRLLAAADGALPLRLDGRRWPASRSRCASSPTPTTTGDFNPGWSLVMAAASSLALAASVYLVLVLEILKLRRAARLAAAPRRPGHDRARDRRRRSSASSRRASSARSTQSIDAPSAAWQHPRMPHLLDLTTQGDVGTIADEAKLATVR